MTPQEFQFLQKMLKERSGLVLADEKRGPVSTRLMPLVKKLNMANLRELIEALKKPTNEPLRRQVTEAMTVNESFFFRDKTPFQNFEEEMIPHLRKTRTNKRVRIWSAAASTGQEAYSLAITTKEQPDKMAGWQIEIFGTDISTEVLEKAKSGLYSQFEVQRGVPAALLVKYFKQTGTMWQVDSALKAMVKFQQFNLLNDFRPLGTFDVVFCRNVLIYFDVETKKDILERISKQMTPDAYLILGGAETIVGVTSLYKPVPGRRGLYQLTSYQESQQKSGGLSAPTRSSSPRLAAGR